MTCDRALDDGAYVLGALSPAERIAYERHLSACTECQRSVAEIAVLPGLLGRLDAETARAVAEKNPPPPQDRLAAAARAIAADRSRRRRRRSWVQAAAGLAVACLALVVGLGLGLGRSEAPRSVIATPSPSPRMVAMKVVRPSAVTAEVALTSGRGGTQITMHCRYGPSSHTKPYVFRLVAYGPDGDREQVSSWLAGTGDDLTITGMTRFGSEDLASLVITKYDGTPLLSYEPP